MTFFSRGGLSIYRDLKLLNKSTFEQFVPEHEWIEATKLILEAAGMSIEALSEVGLSCSCTKERFEEYFGTAIEKKKIRGIKDIEYFVYENTKEIIIPKALKFVEKIFLPKQLFVLSEETMPDLEYYHYTVPNGIRELVKSEFISKIGKRKRQCQVAMIDTGLYPHEHFKKHGYDIKVLPAVSFLDPTKDERGHGTGMASVLLSIADNSKLTMIKAANLNYSFPVAALQKASSLNIEILSCSWGIIGYEPQAHLEIVNLINKEITVVFSAGNGASDRCKSIFQTIACPDILTIGGCMVENEEIEVSDISSSYWSDIYDNRHVPDLCGICGKLPYAQVILMPIQPSALFDFENGKRDGTQQDDGWFVSSGTSAAAAYISGIIAIMKELEIIETSQIISLLKASCKKVRSGKSFMGDYASEENNNLAVGYGFLDFEGIYHTLQGEYL